MQINPGPSLFVRHCERFAAFFYMYSLESEKGANSRKSLTTPDGLQSNPPDLGPKMTAEPIATMQPPEKFTAYIRDAIADLKRKVETPKPKAAASAAKLTSARYQNAIERWLATLTPAQRQRRFSMGEIVKLAGVIGINGKPASIQVMGSALDACGFTQKRDWTKAGRNRRYWKLREQS